jgi:hypothetical protein
MNMAARRLTGSLGYAPLTQPTNLERFERSEAIEPVDKLRAGYLNNLNQRLLSRLN